MYQRLFLALLLLVACPLVSFADEAPTAGGPQAGAPAGSPDAQADADAIVTSPAAGMLRVLTFNVRVGYIPEGANGWRFRRPLVAEAIRSARPDVVGTQECTGVQADEMLADLAGYRTVGKPRRGGELAGLMNVIFYRPEALEPLAKGVFWMSETPDRPGSKGWGNENPRTATWCRFRARADGRELVFVNAHLDHQSGEARDRSGALIARRARELAAGAPVIVTGDFNCTVGSAAYVAMTAAGEGLGLVDALAALHPDAEGMGTYHAYTGESARRIDFVFASPELAPRAAEVVRHGRDGRWPSDHFPVFAEVRWGK